MVRCCPFLECFFWIPLRSLGGACFGVWFRCDRNFFDLLPVKYSQSQAGVESENELAQTVPWSPE